MFIVKKSDIKAVCTFLTPFSFRFLRKNSLVSCHRRSVEFLGLSSFSSRIIPTTKCKIYEYINSSCFRTVKSSVACGFN